LAAFNTSIQKLSSETSLDSSLWNGGILEVGRQTYLSFVAADCLVPGEESLGGNGISQRSREFKRGRFLSSLLIAELSDSAETNVEREVSGRPIWPPGLSGSISHSDLAVAVGLSLSDDFLIGVDIEKKRTVADGLVNRVTSDEGERSLDLSALEIFSAKEAIYKAVSGVLGSEKLSFKHAKLDKSSRKIESLRVFSVEFSELHRAKLLGREVLLLSFESRGFVCSLAIESGVFNPDA